MSSTRYYFPPRKNTQHKLKDAIEKAIQSDNAAREKPLDIKYNCEIVQSKETPELCIVDYLLWSIQRYLLLGDNRFYKALETKYDLIIDLYGGDNESPQYYDQTNKLDLVENSLNRCSTIKNSLTFHVPLMGNLP